jgi:glutamate transport system permease protein
MSSAVLYDVQGPRARRRVLLYSVVGGLLLLALLAIAARRLHANGQFEPDLYTPFWEDPRVARRLWAGLRGTLTAAGYGVVLASVLGVVLAFGRLAQSRFVRIPATTIIEFFRATPLLLLILGFFLAWPVIVGGRLDPLWALVFGLTLYNGAVIAEILRAGILSLPKGQTEAAYALGLTRGQTLRMILLPQALRVMLPSLISQLVVLLKDSSLGFVIAYEELLRVGSRISQNLGNPIQTFALIAVIFIVINFALGRLAVWVEGRQRRRFGKDVLPAGGTGAEAVGAGAAGGVV